MKMSPARGVNNMTPVTVLSCPVSRRSSVSSTTIVKDNSVELIILRKVYTVYLIVTVTAVMPVEIWSSYLIEAATAAATTSASGVTSDSESAASLTRHLNVILQSSLQIVQIVSTVIGSNGLYHRKLVHLGIHLLLSILSECLTLSLIAITSILWLPLPLTLLSVTFVIKLLGIVLLLIIERELINQHSSQRSSRFYLSSELINF